MKDLIKIQSEILVKKSNFNKHLKFKYWTVSDILQAAKPLLKKQKCMLTTSSTVELIGERYYVNCCATIVNEDGETFSVCESAREDETRPGVSQSQVTGATATYAKKRALESLFALDESNDDPDHDTNLPTKVPNKDAAKPVKTAPAKPVNDLASNEDINEALTLAEGLKDKTKQAEIVKFLDSKDLTKSKLLAAIKKINALLKEQQNAA